MSLPKKYDNRIRRILGLRAVCQPGAGIDLGDIVTLRRGIFVPIEALSDFGVRFRRKRSKESELTLNAQGVTETLFQSNLEVPTLGDLKPNTKPKPEINFTRTSGKSSWPSNSPSSAASRRIARSSSAAAARPLQDCSPPALPPVSPRPPTGSSNWRSPARVGRLRSA